MKPSPARNAALVGATLLGAATTTYGQNECTVTSTYAGRWERVELTCGTTADAKPRAAVVSEELRACPLLAGDRVAVKYENDDPARQAYVTAVLARGGTGATAGDWCSSRFSTGLFTGPCELTEVPPFEERTNKAGDSWVRTTVGTLFRDANDNRASVSPGGCAPLKLTPGVSRIYVTKTIRRATWKPCANNPERVCEESTSETNRYEGGIYVDGALEPVESVTDVSPLVRGWGTASVEAVAQAPPVSVPLEATPAVPPWTGCGEAWDAFLAEVDEEPPSTVSVTPAQQDTIEHTLTVAQLDEAQQIGELLAQGFSFSAVQQRWENFVAGLASGDVPLDVNALVQWVLSESYEETSADLRFYADKVGYFNERKEAIRDWLRETRDQKSNLEASLRSSGDSSHQWTAVRPPARLAQVSMPGDPRLAPIENPDELAENIAAWEEKLASICHDAQLSNTDLQGALERQQQTMQTMSNISKMLHDTAMAVIRKIGE